MQASHIHVLPKQISFHSVPLTYHFSYLKNKRVFTRCSKYVVCTRNFFSLLKHFKSNSNSNSKGIFLSHSASENPYAFKRYGNFTIGNRSPSRPWVIRSRGRWDYDSDEEYLSDEQEEMYNRFKSDSNSKKFMYFEFMSSLMEALKALGWTISLLLLFLALTSFVQPWIILFLAALFIAVYIKAFRSILSEAWAFLLRFSSSPLSSYSPSKPNSSDQTFHYRTYFEEDSSEAEWDDMDKTFSRTYKSGSVKPDRMNYRTSFEKSSDYYASDQDDTLINDSNDFVRNEKTRFGDVRDNDDIFTMALPPSTSSNNFIDDEKSTLGPYFGRMSVPAVRKRRKKKPGSLGSNRATQSKSPGLETYSNAAESYDDKDKPYLNRILFALFPFLRSWGGFL